ncbi:hypothetical protein [Pedobacter sp. BMA]|uniref:hypothetical protein n=1 Tax=Pedobacter sp. BMA TaxID=1663685 RepID=UPI0006492DAE|nr:hypothetical protein [Pedobacter sp. BMA]KLT64540.1 hypothetical protein AB669_12275 [Pedobacter sp. BMA]
MKQILKSIGFGIVLGAIAFFIPFIFKFIFGMIIIGFVFKMFFRGRRHRRLEQHFENFSSHYAPVVPIDNQWYKPVISENGYIQNINVNYQ